MDFLTVKLHIATEGELRAQNKLKKFCNNGATTTQCLRQKHIDEFFLLIKNNQKIFSCIPETLLVQTQNQVGNVSARLLGVLPEHGKRN